MHGECMNWKQLVCAAMAEDSRIGDVFREVRRQQPQKAARQVTARPYLQILLQPHFGTSHSGTQQVRR